MSEMSVKLTLTLNDLGSPGLRAFQALIQALGPAVTGLSNRINTLERSFERAGNAASKAAGQFGIYDTQVARSTTTTGAATAATTAFEGAVNGLTAAVRAAMAIMASMATTASALASSMNTMATGANNAAGSLGHVNTALGTMQGRVNGLTQTLRGMAEMWAAQKLFQAEKASVHEASEFQMIEARIKALNYPDAVNKAMVTQAKDLSKNLGFISTSQALEARIGAVAGLGRDTSPLMDPQVNDIISKTLPQAIKAAMILQMRGDKSELKDIIRNLYELADVRGQTSRPDEMNSTFDLMQRTTASGGMKVSIKDVVTVLRQTKTISSLLSDEGFVNMVSLADQFKAMGSGGGGSGGQGVSMVGTMFNAVAKFASGGIVNKQSLSIMQTMGLMDSNAKITGDTDTTQVNVGPKGMKHSAEFLRDPVDSIIKYFAPAMLKFTLDNPNIFYKGTDPNDPNARAAAMMEVALMITKGQGGVSMAAALQLGALPATSSKIQETTALSFQSKDTDKSLADLRETLKLNVKDFSAAVDNLALAFGQKLLPAITKVVEWLGKFITWLNELAEDHPTIAFLAVIATVIGTIALAIAGIGRVFGIWSILGSFVTSTTGYVIAFGAAWVTASTAVGSVLTLIGAALLRLIPLIGVFFAAWSLGTWLSKLSSDGVTVRDWVSGFMNDIVSNFERGWIRVKAFVGLISDAQRDVLLRESRERQKMIGDQTSKGASSGWGSGASSSWGTALPGKTTYSETPEERRTRELNEQVKKLAGNYKWNPPDPNAGKHFYNPDAEASKQDARITAAQEVLMLRTLDAAYHAHEISIQDYYDKKKKIIETNQEAIIAALVKEKTALENPAKGKRDEKAIATVSADITLAAYKQKETLEANESNRVKDLNTLKFLGVDAERQADSVQGHRHMAEIKRLDEELAKKKEWFAINNMPGAAAAIDVAHVKAVGGINYDESFRILKAKLDEFKQKEEEITDSVTAGTRTQFEAEHELWLLRIQEGATIDAALPKLKEYASAYQNEAAVRQVGEYSRLAKKDLQTLSPEVLKIKEVLENSFGNFFNQLITGTKNIGQAFKGLFNDIAAGISSFVSKELGQQLFKSMFGGGIAGGAGGGFFSLLMGGKGGMGGYSTNPDTGDVTGSGGIWASLASWWSGLSFDAGIDRVPSDMLALIHKDEAVLKPDIAASYRAGNLGGQGRPVMVTNYFNVPAPTSMTSQSQIATMVGDTVNRAQRRNG